MRKLFLLLAVTMCVNTISTNTPSVTELFPASSMRSIITKNRETLAMIPQWIDDTVYNNALYWYGLPECVRHLIDKPIGDEITYSDAMIYLTRLLKKNICYLELGTSFGKNFLQIAHAVSNSTLVGFDLEKISPVMEGFFSNKTLLDEWDTNPITKDIFNSPYHSPKKDNSSLTKYSQKTNNNTILYLSGEVFDEQSWQRLQGTTFNVIFSDACHHPNALLHEYAMLEKYNLIDPDEFIFIWDDLGGEMTVAFMHIFEMLSKKHQLDPDQGFVIPLRGWLGVNTSYHNVGIIMHVKKES